MVKILRHMNYKIITLIENKIKISEFINNREEIDKKDGEEFQTYDKTTFWDWWLDRIEYNDEEFCFIIFTDTDSFTIPETVVIAESVNIDNKIVAKIIKTMPANLNLITYPQIDSTTYVEDTNEVDNFTPAPKGSIAEYFQNKTEIIRT